MGKNKNIIWLNNKLIPEEKVLISILDSGFLYGYGLFETMRAYQGKFFCLDKHIKRLIESSKIINLNIDKKINFAKIIEFTLKENPPHQNSYVRLSVWQQASGISILVAVKEYFPLEEKYHFGFKTIISKKVIQNEFSIFSKIKSMNRLVYQLAQKEANSKGLDEALILNTKGFLTEGSRTNIFLIKNNVLFTPSLESGCLAGITREVVLELAKKIGLEIYEKEILPKQIFEVDEVFLTNSLIEIMPVCFFENKPIKKAIPGPITQELRKQYQNLNLK